jgi:hypothetical protein
MLSREELNAKLEESFAAVERGETISGEEYEAEMDAWRARELQVLIDEGLESASTEPVVTEAEA